MTNTKDILDCKDKYETEVIGEENRYFPGKRCNCCVVNVNCPNGGAPTGLLNFADFYALMPADNPDPIAPGESIAFPQNGPIGGTGITRINDETFNLVNIGTYQIMFEASINETGQLVLALNGNDLAYTVVGRSAGTSQIVGMALVTTTVANSTLTLRNPTGNDAILTLTQNAGGERSVSAHLVITQIR